LQQRGGFLHNARERLEQFARLQQEASGHVAKSLLQQFGRKNLAGAVGQIVRLVNQKDGRGQPFPVQMAQSGAGIEDVIVIRRDGVRAPGQFQLHLERADFFLFGRGENGVGIKMGMAFPQAVEQARFFHFRGIILGVRAKIFMTKDAVVGAHFFLGADLRRAKRAAGFIARKMETAILCCKVLEVRNTTCCPAARPCRRAG
jgi:hypothetical protein